MIRLPCKTCGSVDYPKPLRRRKKKDGSWQYFLIYKCIMCCREDDKIFYEKKIKDKKYVEKRLKKHREWYKRNRDRVLQQKKIYLDKNRLKIIKYRRGYYLNNRDRILKKTNLRYKKKDKKENKKQNNQGHIWRKNFTKNDLPTL